MRLATKLRMPFKPFVTLEQMLAYDHVSNPNPTPSLLINKVLFGIVMYNIKSLCDMARCLELTPVQLGRPIEVVTGMTFDQINLALLKHRLERLKAEHPDWNTDQLAKAIGYADRASLWNTLNRDKVNARNEEMRRRWRKRMGLDY